MCRALRLPQLQCIDQTCYAAFAARMVEDADNDD